MGAVCKSLLFGLLATTIAACEGISAKEPATKAEQERANVVFLKCLIVAAPNYDDPSVPIDDVARVLMTGPCHAASDAVIETYIRGTSFFVQKYFRRDFEQGIGLDMAKGVLTAFRQSRMDSTKT